MPKLNGWDRLLNDDGLKSKTKWRHEGLGELVVLKHEGFWFVNLEEFETDGEPDEFPEVFSSKQDAKEFAREFMRKEPVSAEERGKHMDVRFSIVLPKNYNNGRSIPQEDLKRYAEKLAERFGGFTMHEVKGGWMNNGGVQTEDVFALVVVRDAEDRVPIKEDESWLESLAERARQEFGQAEIMIREDRTEHVEFVGGSGTQGF
jgi:hypothetical protein